ncbi:YegS/Rv2252/BmrU family lipid kinase [Zymomonas mobilis]|uniref:YegS/Rv2252/BmrU family lipid kinase n=2 Tax=Zymomonas mobilis TaxID=542 RepID=A0A542W2E5_ZYMMB|nr:YegS/Rv2252/BmrU family lipid kinase [Zymomonas mobilis]
MVSKRIAIIVNPIAGKRRPHSVHRFAGYLKQAGFDVRIEKTLFPGHATELARQLVESRQYGYIVAAGGDGTIAEVAEAVVGSEVIFCILPIGTANVLAHELSINFDERQNASNIIKGYSTTIWPAFLQNDGRESLFVQMLGIGIDAHIVHHISSRLKRVMGKAAYALQMLRSLWQYELREMSVSIDGQIYEKATSVIISKGALYAGEHRLLPESKQKDEVFAAVLFQSRNKIDYLLAASAFFMGKVSHCRHIKVVTAKSVEINAPDKLPIQSDGDIRGFTPATVTISTKALKVAAPI